MNGFWHSKRCVQVQFENYEKSKATKSRLNTKRGIGELAFQAQTAPIPLLTPTFCGLIFFYNSLRFTCPHLCCAESRPHHRIDCPILLNRLFGKQKIFCWREAAEVETVFFYNRLRSEWDFVLLDRLWSAEIRARQGLALWVLRSLDAPWSCRYDTDKQAKPLCGPDPEPLPTQFRTCLLFMELNRRTQVQNLRRISDWMRLSRNKG